MNKKQILEMTGLSESDFYKQYPTQEAFIKKYKSGGIINVNEFMNTQKPSMYGDGGRILKDIGAGAYGVLEGTLDTLTMGATDQLTDAGYKGLQKLGNSTEEEIRQQNSIHGYGQAAGAITSGIINPAAVGTAISEGSQGVGQGIAQGSPDSKLAQDVGKYLPMAGSIAGMAAGSPAAGSAGAAKSAEFASSNLGRFTNSAGKVGKGFNTMGSGDPMQMLNMFGGTGNIEKMKDGGMIPEGKALINVEKNELEVNPDSLEVVKHFKNKPNHPAYGIDEQGNTLATVGNVIIPKNMSDLYEKSDTYEKEAMVNNLKYNQTKREGGVYEYGLPNIPMAKYGGMIKKYAEGSVVTGPRADGGFYNFDNPVVPAPAPNNIYGNFPRVDTPDMNTTPSMQASNRLANRLSNPISKWNTNTINKPLDYSYNVAGRQEFDKDGNRVSVNPMAPTNYQAPGSELRKQPMSMDKYGDIASKVGMYAPAAYNLIRGFDKPYSMDSSKYMTSDIQAPQMTGDAGRRDMLTAYNTGKYNINQLRTSGTLSGLINNNNKYSQNLATYNENLENKNKLLTFEASRSNQDNQRGNNQLRMGLDQFNEQNRAAKRNFTSTALTQGSDILQSERNNKMTAEAIRQSGQYGYFDKNGKYIIKGSEEDIKNSKK